ncbi:unnamed protein product [Urochloa humidicola]
MEMLMYVHTGIRSAHRAGDPRPRGDKGKGGSVHGGGDGDRTGMGLCGKGRIDLSADEVRGLCFADSVEVFMGAKMGLGPTAMGGGNMSACAAFHLLAGSSMGGQGVHFGIRTHTFDEKEEALNTKGFVCKFLTPILLRLLTWSSTPTVLFEAPNSRPRSTVTIAVMA